MLGEITTALASLKAASDIIKGFNSLQLEVAVKEKSTELLNIIITLQQNIFSLQAEYENVLNTKSELEKELEQLKNWERTKEKYVLKEIAPDVLAYVHKKPEESASEKHWLCANCFDNYQKESIYQISKRGNIPSHVYYCPQCKNDILVRNPSYQPPKPVTVRRNPGDNWVTRF